MISAVSPKFAQIRSEALELTKEERVRLAEELFDSAEEADGAPEEIEAAWGEEIARRLKKLDDGTAVLHDAAVVSREIRDKLRARHGS
jgi:putative addiction module component (TIGR02574 family)